MNTYPEIRVELVFTSKSLDSTRLPDSLGLVSDRSWNRGDSVAGTIMAHKLNGCAFGSGVDSACAFEEHLKALRHRMSLTAVGAARLLQELERGWSVELSCVIYATAEMPAIHFDAGFLQWLATFRAAIDMDIYSLEG